MPVASPSRGEKRGSAPGEHRGPGRKGIPNKRTVHKELFTKRAAQAGITPLEVMLDNLYFCVSDMPVYAQEFQGALTDVTAGDLSDESLIRVERTLDKLMKCRGMAQSIAVDAAPYMHPKFAAIATFNGDKENQEMEFVLQIGDRAITTGVHRRDGAGSSETKEDNISETLVISETIAGPVRDP